METETLVDSLGEVPGTRSERSAPSSRKTQLLEIDAKLRDRADREFVVKTLAKLSAIYGQPKDRTPELARVMAAEWTHILEPYPKTAIATAVEGHMRASKFWPTPAEIIERVRAATKDLREEAEHLRAQVAPRIAAPVEPDRSSPEEQQRRADAIARAHAAVKVSYPYTPAFDAWADQVSEPAPASQGGASDHLINSAAAKRARESAARKQSQAAE